MDAENYRKFKFGDYKLDPRSRRLLKANNPISLNAKAFDLLLFLAQNSGRAVSKDEILHAVWPDQVVEESNLAVQISAIRKALGDQKGEPRFLVTIPGKGYQFVAKVLTAEDSAQSGATSNEAKAVPTRQASRSSRRFFIIAALAGVLLVLTVLGVRFGLMSRQPSAKSIAVLPFDNQTGGATAEYLVDGLAESVIFSLSRVPGLMVMSRESSFRYRSGQTDAKTVGKGLGVETILMGRIVQFGDSVSIRTELVSTKDNSVVWGEQFTRNLSDIEKLQIDIAQSITRELKIKLTEPDKELLRKNQTENHEAYQLYLLGRYHLNRLTDDGFLKGRDNFRKAVEIDPKYAVAYAGLADSYNLLCGWGALAPNEGYPLAKASALKALELDETLAEAHSALGIVKLFYDTDWSGAEGELQRAIEINPSDADALMMYGHALMLEGRFDEAHTFMARAKELDPLSIIRIVSAGNIFYFQRNHASAIETYEQALSMDPNSGLAHWSLGNALLQAHRIDESIAEYQKSIPLSGDSPDEPASLAYAFAVTGKPTEARKIINELSGRGNSYVPKSLNASIYGALGEKDKAFDLLEQAFRERDSLLVYLKVDPIFDPLRSDPRFPILLKRIGLQP